MRVVQPNATPARSAPCARVGRRPRSHASVEALATPLGSPRTTSATRAHPDISALPVQRRHRSAALAPTPLLRGASCAPPARKASTRVIGVPRHASSATTATRAARGVSRQSQQRVLRVPTSTSHSIGARAVQMEAGARAGLRSRVRAAAVATVSATRLSPSRAQPEPTRARRARPTAPTARSFRFAAPAARRQRPAKPEPSVAARV